MLLNTTRLELDKCIIFKNANNPVFNIPHVVLDYFEMLRINDSFKMNMEGYFFLLNMSDRHM